MGAFCRVGLSGDYYLPSLQRAHRPRWTTLSASEPGAGDKLGARLRHSPRVCLVLHELALVEPALSKLGLRRQPAGGIRLRVSEHLLDSKQAASAKQFERQSDRYGKSHILANTEDVDMAMKGIAAPAGGTALDVGTGGGHTALWLAHHGWKVMAGDIAPRMLKNAAKLCAEAGLTIETQLFPAEKMPFAAGSYDLVTARVGPHHFSSPEQVIGEVGRGLNPGGHFQIG